MNRVDCPACGFSWWTDYIDAWSDLKCPHCECAEAGVNFGYKVVEVGKVADVEEEQIPNRKKPFRMLRVEEL